jgi:peptidyl-prolyl cis-trans isomerase C
MNPPATAFRRVACAASLVFVVTGSACSKEPAAPADEPAASAAESAPAGAEAAAATNPAAGPVTPAAAGQAATADQKPLTPEEVPAVVARIDGADVTRQDLLTRAVEARGALAQRGVPPPEMTRGFLRGVLDDVIGSRLLAADLAAKGLAPSAAEVDAQVQALRSQFPSDEAFDRELAARGFDRARLRRDLVESMTVQKWVEGEVVPSIAITEADARAFYDANPERMIEPEKTRARHILFRVEPDANEEQKRAARQQIEQARQRITDGADFAAVARELSADRASAERGGDLGWFYRGQMVGPFDAAAFSLEPGKLSEPVETRFGFHLIEVQERAAQRDVSFEEVRPKIETTLKQRQLEQRVKSRINELGSEAAIEILL